MNSKIEAISFLFFICFVKFSEGGLKCHYCGIEDLCPLPYDPIDANFITCPHSCLKFDGIADGKRVIIRDCGEPEVDVCGEEPEKYANTRAEGTLCTCMSDKCNDGSRLTISGILLTAAIIIVIKLTQ